MKTIRNRIEALEQRNQSARGIVIFQQDIDEPEAFYVHSGAFPTSDRPYSREEISAVAAQGWQVITLVYEDRPMDTNVKLDNNRAE